jgi:uncharacterized protein (TIGR02328 family)
MRLWHEKLIKYLPRQQLLGQHRECAAMRGNGWGKKHSVVDYVFKYHWIYLYFYHKKIMNEMKRRGYKVTKEWEKCTYRGKKCPEYKELGYKEIKQEGETIYKEHDKQYYQECINNLKNKGIIIHGGVK